MMKRGGGKFSLCKCTKQQRYPCPQQMKLIFSQEILIFTKISEGFSTPLDKSIDELEI